MRRNLHQQGLPYLVVAFLLGLGGRRRRYCPPPLFFRHLWPQLLTISSLFHRSVLHCTLIVRKNTCKITIKKTFFAAYYGPSSRNISPNCYYCTDEKNLDPWIFSVNNRRYSRVSSSNGQPLKKNTSLNEQVKQILAFLAPGRGGLACSAVLAS
jgi:hypothetical protein